jgi:hypothetical protein
VEQSKHIDDDGSFMKRPAIQAEQTVDDDAVYFPGKHSPVTAERPTVAQNDPDGHSVHDPAPVET